MRRIAKLEPPDVLTANGAKWTQEYIEAREAGGPTPKPWSRPAIRARLHEETLERCAYCEAWILPTAPGDIEHIKPREKFPKLVVAWDNLTIACPRCNSEKSSKWDDATPFVNPYVDDIDDHFVFFGPFVMPISDRGVATVEAFGLNEWGRPEARKRALDAISLHVAAARTTTSPAGKAFYDRLIRQLLDGEFSATLQSFLRSANYL